MKTCTVLRQSDDDLVVTEVSLVDDNHHFGWHEGGELHVEGTCEVIDGGDTWEIVPVEVIEEEGEDPDDDNADDSIQW